MAEMKTVLEGLQAGAAWLDKKGVPEPRRNMEWLLAHVLGLKRLDLYLQFDRPLGEAELAPLRELMRRRGAREPLQHILGTVEFAGRTFRCDARALIPRPETEELALHLLAAGQPADRRVADIGCGSGVLGFTLAAAGTGETILADIEADALALAAENRDALGLDPQRVRLVASDLFSALDGRFGLVVANLPYIPDPELVSLQAEVAFDPRRALDGGPDGLRVLRRFVDALPDRLEPGGSVALEVGSGQGATVAAWLAAAGLADVRVLPDLGGHDRFVMAGP